MKLINSYLSSSIINDCQANFGTIYFFENFVVTEVDEGIVFDWNCLEQLISSIQKYYGDNTKIHIISNRINNYSVVPTDWLKFYQQEYSKLIKSISFVTYNKLSLSNVKLEQDFIPINSECFDSITNAVDWLHNSFTLKSA